MDSATNTNNIAIGCHLSIKTTFGDEFQAQVIAYDRAANLLALQDSTKQAGARRDIRLLKTNYIKEFKLISTGAEPIDFSKCYIDLNGIQAREEAAVRQAEIEAERIGVGVTSEAQNLFDALAKTLPVRWDKTVIVVMNEVRVASPYTPECVSGGTASANGRVRKVLEFERKRLQQQAPGSG